MMIESIMNNRPNFFLFSGFFNKISIFPIKDNNPSTNMQQIMISEKINPPQSKRSFMFIPYTTDYCL